VRITIALASKVKELAGHQVGQLKRKRPVGTLTVGDLFVAPIPPLERLKTNANFTPRTRETAPLTDSVKKHGEAALTNLAASNYPIVQINAP
jgi:FMN-dependent NADH-azoreductase